MTAALALDIAPETRRITCTLKQALALLTLERDVAGVIQCARIALDQGSETERAVAVSALMVVGGQEASELRTELVRVLGWDSAPESNQHTLAAGMAR